MGYALALIVLGALILMDKMGAGYGVKEGWPLVVIALGLGGIIRNVKSVFAWMTTILGILMLSTKFYTIQIKLPALVKTYFGPIVLIVVGILWLFIYRRD